MTEDHESSPKTDEYRCKATAAIVRYVAGAVLLLAIAWFLTASSRKHADSKPWQQMAVKVQMTPMQRAIVDRARLEVTRGVKYDASYQRIPYPKGDVASDRGACTDVVVRALRAAGYDLQELIHKDKLTRPRTYPHLGATAGTDTNIDHRRTPNHMVYLRRHALVLTTETDSKHATQWQPGDLVYVRLFGSTLHCGVVSDRQNDDGVPLLIHNIGPVASEDDSLQRWTILGHFRMRVRDH